jgi:hypothetical protein
MTANLDDGSHAWCVRLLSELDAADARAMAVAQTLTNEQLNWRAHPAEWSVGQCLDHLRMANEVYCASISSALADRPFATVEEITPGWFGRWFIRNYIEPSSQMRRGRAPKKIVPSAQVDTSILDRFLESNRSARALIRRASKHDVNRIRFQNPFVPIIRFTVGTGLEILSKHERRHLLQAERIRASLESHESRNAT